jgi:DNA processing protein
MSRTTLLPLDPLYPEPLRALPRPPASLRVEGTLPPLTRAVAVVGTRHTDDDALDFAHALSRELARAGVVVVSGGARGIDAAAHEGALAGGGATVVVAAGGLDRPYPPEHADLFARVVAAGGALLTEADDDVAPLAARFLQRNRIVAALACVVVVVQAPARSGALGTASAAKRLGRPLFAVPGAPWDPRATGCLGLLRAGAGVCTSARDLLSHATLGGGPALPGAREKSEKRLNFNDFDTDSRAVLAQLSRRARHVDEVARGATLSVSRTQAVLLRLLLRGVIEDRGAGRYVIAPPPA